MMDSGDAGFAALEARVDKLLANLDAGQRRALARRVGTDLRRSQIQRVRAQLNPDGSPFQPRKPKTEQLRGKKGRIKRKAKRGPMFRKLMAARRLRLQATASGVSLGFADNATARIARVHQFGLPDRVNRRPNAPTAQYPARELLGLTQADRAMILDRVLEALSGM
ncbi:MAG: phage virion morphogenesis protein [Bacillota bacterium]